MQSYDVAIIGAGAAGLMCAMTAGARGKRVVLIDHLDHAGAKILISGGGRCNFTNLDTRPDRYFSENPRFCTSALARYRPADFVALIEKHRIAYHEKKLGQLFCDGSAKAVVAMLLDECAAAGVTLRLGTSITAVSRAERFRLDSSAGPIEAAALVLATGGLSIPKMGATDFSHRLARQFGLKTTQTRPALVPLTFAGEDLAAMQALSGVSVDCRVRVAKNIFRENLLFTHRGLSGPAVLQVSSAWTQEGQKTDAPLRLDLLPETDATALLLDRKRTRPKAQLASVLEEVLPQRLARQLAAEAEAGMAAGRVMADLPDRLLRALGQRLNDWRPVPTGTEGYAKAEATRGGIDTRGLSSRSLEASAVSGLYAIGEAVDVVGWLGGYNFQWAWASGFCAGEAIAQS